MCTAILVKAGDGFFGRNLDFEIDFGQRIVVVPRKYRFGFCDEHYAIIGMAVVDKNYPLIFDGINEAGLGMAGLRFAGNAVYNGELTDKINVASFELIPMVLARCKNVAEAVELVKNMNITNRAFSAELPPSPLHWMIADREQSVVVEQTKKGMRIYQNPVCVLTNNPEFPVQMENLANYINLTAGEPENRFLKNVDLKVYSRGMGAIGLPGDMSSMSRFVKTAFICENSVYDGGENEIVNHFFHTLYSVFQQRGCVRVGDSFEVTNYSCCGNLKRGIYYYTTYNDSTIKSVNMHSVALDGGSMIEFSL